MLYNNLLLYSPPPTSPEDTFQVEGAAAPVQCGYKRCIYKTIMGRSVDLYVLLMLCVVIRIVTKIFKTKEKKRKINGKTLFNI